MHRLTALFLLPLLLIACARLPVPEAQFRHTGTSIWANAVTDPMRLTGHWTQVAAFAAPAAAGCRAGGADLSQTTQGLYAAVQLCLNGVPTVYRGPLQITGPGQVRPVGKAQPPLDRDWWVLWVDADLRTLVIGTPDGRFGTILNRDGNLPADRRRAARDVLRWNGYDLSQLVEF